jgi:hypothetical protein
MITHEEELELMKNELPEAPARVRIEDIRPSMTEVDRERALAEIMRVLRGED